MKTTAYNPSRIEVDFSNAVQDLRGLLQAELKDHYNITGIVPFNNKDNPYLVLSLIDEDGDAHELVISFIQRPDK